MKKVLIAFIETGKAGGIDRYILNMYDHIRDDAQVDFLTNKTDPALQEYLQGNGSSLFEVPGLLNPVGQYKAIKSIVSKNKYDTVYFNISTALTFPGIAAAKFAGAKKVVIHSHSTAIDCSDKTKRNILAVLHKICRKFIYRFGTDYCACSKDAGLWMFPKHTVAFEKVFVVNNCIDTDKFKYDLDTRSKKRKELGLSDESYVLGHVGNFLYQKNHAFLISVFAEYAKLDEDAVLLLVGDGPLQPEIKDRVCELGLLDKVIFAGRVDTREYLQAMDLFLLPSNFEGLGMVAVEAQCSGLYCLLSDRVPVEADLTGENRFLTLNSIQPWVDAIQAKKASESTRCDNSDVVLEKGYSLKEYDFKKLI